MKKANYLTLAILVTSLTCAGDEPLPRSFRQLTETTRAAEQQLHALSGHPSESSCTEDSTSREVSSENLLRSFCKDPFHTVCPSHTGSDSKIQLQKAIERSNRLKQGALLDVATRVLHLSRPDAFTVREMSRISPISLHNFVYGEYLDSLQRQVEKELGLQNGQLQEQILKIKEQVRIAVSSNPSISAPMRQKMLAKVDSLNFPAISAVLNSRAPFVSQEIQGTCGIDGTEEDATTLNEPIYGKKTAIICPGLYIAAITEERGKPALNFSKLLFELAHEIGHVIDSDTFPTLYMRMASCLRLNYSTVLEESNQIMSYVPEVGADYWGVEALVQYLSNPPKSRGQALVSAFEALCGSEDLNGHPRDEIRIGSLIRLNPALARLAGCSSPVPAKPSCAWVGE